MDDINRQPMETLTQDMTEKNTEEIYRRKNMGNRRKTQGPVRKRDDKIDQIRLQRVSDSLYLNT